MSSVLFKLFREKNGLTYEAGIFNPIRQQNSPFLIYLSVSNKNAIIKFNKIEMTKTGFEDLVKTHHAMFSEISFPEGWMETVNYVGNDVKNAGGKYLDDFGSTWTSHWSDWTAVSKISGDTISNPCFFGYKWENEKIIEVSAIFPDEAFNKEFAMFIEANKK